jgi:molybdate transport system regulatory protein
MEKAPLTQPAPANGTSIETDASLGGAPPPVVRLRLWLETEDGMFFGTGRGMLLEAVDRFGSLKKAAEHLGMSYRAAWGKIKKTEKVLGVMLIEQAGSRKSGHRLTPGGRLLMGKFREWYEAVENSAVDKARELFPWTCLSFKQARERKRALSEIAGDADES